MCGLFSFLINKPSRLRKISLGVKEKYVGEARRSMLGGQGEVRRGSRGNATSCMFFLPEYNTFIWALKGLIIENVIFDGI